MYIDSTARTSGRIDVKRITAAWAFSESAFGAILHSLKIPFAGLFIGSAAVFFISIIAQQEKKPAHILRATMLVILVKAVTAPYTPLNSFMAVTIQGGLGYLFFKFIPSKKIAAILLGAAALLLSSMQKIIVMTILFGTAFWTAVDSFVRYTFSILSDEKYLGSFSISLILILVYALIHMAAGIYIGFRSIRFEKWIGMKRVELNSTILDETKFPFSHSVKRRKKGGWWKKKSGIAVIVFIFMMVILTYTLPGFGNFSRTEIFILIIRSVVITLLWFKIISPFITRMFGRYISRKQISYAGDLESITLLFPDFRNLIGTAWNQSSTHSGIKRFRKFISDSLALLLIGKIKYE